MRITAEHLQEFCQKIGVIVGLPEADAFTLAECTVFANLRGIDSHGIMRFPLYIKRLNKQGSKTHPSIQVVRETATTATVDGDDGMGQVIGLYAANVAIKKAREYGMSYVGVRGSAHYGPASYYAMKIAEQRMIGISISNTTPVMAAWGAGTSVIGNNPLAIAVPYQHGAPIVFDISMSRVAGGKVRLAAKNKQSIPKGWILDKNGRATENPDDFEAGGTLLPLAEHKGWGLAFMLEILSATLPEAGMLGQIPLWFTALTTPLNIGHAFLAIDIAGLMEFDHFQERLHWLVEQAKLAPVAEGFTEILVPGEIDARIEADRRVNGIPLTDAVYQDLVALSNTYNVPLATIPEE